MKPILSRGKNLWCETAVDAAGIVVDADDYYRCFYRAAKKARRSILLSGWQFDSDVELLRGDEARAQELPTSLKAFLNALCERNDELQVFILAWDFHMVFALEREWMQKLLFQWTTHEHLNFRFDSSHVDQGSHHQKFVIIDGELSFLGGLDLCDHRWDDRRHLDANPARVSRGSPHKPFHDVQAYLVGTEAAQRLTELFACRWELAGGDPFTLVPASATPPTELVPSEGIPLSARCVALSRTDPKGSPTKTGEVREVLDLYLDAIDGAERSIYVETQYFSSRTIGEALVKRIRAEDRSPLEIILVLNMRAETLKEEVAVGLAQAKVLADLRTAAQGTAHQLGVYYTVPASEGDKEPERATYIHSKVMIIDDRFLNVGSANLTNRSGSVDTELNASFEATSSDGELGVTIRRVRRSLIAEHLGLPEVGEGDDSVARLDERARSRDGRLRIHPSPTENERAIIEVVDPQALPFDPAGVESDDDRSLFVEGIGALFLRVFNEHTDAKVT